jgi:hypothetical protein
MLYFKHVYDAITLSVEIIPDTFQDLFNTIDCTKFCVNQVRILKLRLVKFCYHLQDKAMAFTMLACCYAKRIFREQKLYHTPS